MNRNFFTILITIICSSSNAQGIYYSSISGSITLPEGLRTEIGIFDPISCTKQELYIDFTFGNPTLEWNDIAVCPDGNLYGLSHDGIYLIDLNAQSYLKILDNPPYPRWEKGLACTKDSILIFGERDILGYNLNGGGLKHYGRVPASLTLWSNIFFLEGKIMASIGDEIILLDTLVPSNSSVYCSISKSGLLSVTEMVISCDSIAYFAFFVDGEVYLLNPATCSLTFQCKVNPSFNGNFQGTQPDFMFMTPDPCKISIDLDYFDETINGIDYIDTVLCDLPSNILFSTVNLISDKQWDSLKIWIDSGPSSIMLEGRETVFATLQGSGTRILKYTSDGTSDLGGIATFLSDLHLIGAMPFGTNNIKIGFAAWAQNLISDTAYAYITLIGPSTSAGQSGSVEVCSSDEPFDLSAILSPDADVNGVWQPETLTNGVFEPNKDRFGTYHYIIHDPNCGFDSANFEILSYPVPVLNIPDDLQSCPGDTFLIELNINNAFITWPDGTIGNTKIIIGPDTLHVQIIDEYGCEYYDTLSVTYKTNCSFDDIFIPNVFSPNGDGINDFWIIELDPNIILVETTIYDRWGGAVYNNRSSSVNWNGLTNDNKPVLPGVYSYILSLQTVNGERQYKVGDLTVIK